MSPARVINAGYPGDTTRELLARFDRDVTPHSPDLVILWAGVNDMLYCGHTVPPKEFRRNFRRLVHRCRIPGSAVAAGTLPPRINAYLFEQFPGAALDPVPPDERVECANEILRELSAELDFPLIDFEGLVRSRPVAEEPASLLRNFSNSGMRDGLHLTPEGYRLAAELAFEVIRREHLPCSCIVCFGDSLTYGPWLKGRGTAAEGAEPYPARLAALLRQAEAR